jgi:hypothetical protein
MPVKSCTLDGKKGYKWGDEGTCYVGADGYDRALAQGQAINASKFAETYRDYPKAASANAKRALDWAEKEGWGSCGTPVGKARANQLAKGEAISEDTIARMSGFARHKGNSTTPYGEGCGKLMWDAWGGTEGIEWAARKLKQIRAERAQKATAHKFTEILKEINQLKQQLVGKTKLSQVETAPRQWTVYDKLGAILNFLKK